MNTYLATIIGIIIVAALLFAISYPLGGWMHRVFTDEKHWAIERWIYKLIRVDPDTEQRWGAYTISVVAFGVVSVLGLFAIIMFQPWLPWGLGRTQDWHTALNTAISFTTNTNWQSYAPEAGAGYTVQMAGLTVQNFVSAGTGIAVAIALFRAFARKSVDRIGNFWVDLTRSCIRVLLPISIIGAIILIAAGVIQNLSEPFTVTTVTGSDQVIQAGPVASQEVIKELGTNGGGFFNANSSHPFESPNAFTNLMEFMLELIIPFGLTRTYALMVKDKRQGWLIAAVMYAFYSVAAMLTTWAETAAQLPTGSMEGKEARFGISWSVLFATATTGTSTGAVDSMHDSYSGLGGGLVMFNMMLGEVSPGGVGTGMYGMLIMAVITVFIAGLMVGRTPEMLGKTIGRKEITYAGLSALLMPALVLIFTSASMIMPVAVGALNNTGPHGLSEMMYAFVSGSNNNGSAFAGISADQPWLNLTIGFCMFVARFGNIALTLALAGCLVKQQKRPETAGTMPTHNLTFGVLLTGVVLIIAGLTFFPALALGPIAEALQK